MCNARARGCAAKAKGKVMGRKLDDRQNRVQAKRLHQERFHPQQGALANEDRAIERTAS
jgi:hypothetical protein